MTLENSDMYKRSNSSSSSGGGGLVQNRVDFFEAPMREPQNNGYRHRPQDSFAAVLSRDDDEEEHDNRDDEQRQDESTAPPSPTTNSTQVSSRTTYPSDSSVPPGIARSHSRGGAVGSALTDSGLRHYHRGEYSHAQKAFTTVLKTQRAAGSGNDDDDLSLAVTLGNLGAVSLKQEKLDDAEHFLQESLQLKRLMTTGGSNNNNIIMLADTLNNLGNCANVRGQYDESMRYYSEALDELRAHTTNHKQQQQQPVEAAASPSRRRRQGQLANLLFNIGRLEIQQQHWNAALAVLSEAWRLTREVYGNCHVHVAQTLDLLGFIQLSTGQYDASIVSFTSALSIYRRLHGPLHVDVAAALFNVGMVREARGDVQDAGEAYSTARDLYVRLGTEENDPGYTTVRRSVECTERVLAEQRSQGDEKKRRDHV